MSLLEATGVCEQKENMASDFCKCGKQKRNINYNAVN
jgi:hypothetical protein